MLTNILNGLIVLGVFTTILVLVFIHDGSKSIVQIKVLDDIEHYYYEKISIQQLDSLSASSNLIFTESFQDLNLETINSGKNSVLH